MNVFNAESAINSFGLTGIFVILFVETSLPLVVGLPGDSLLFIAGLAASGTGQVVHVKLNLAALAIGAPIAAILGSSFGQDRKSTRLNSSHSQQSRMPSSA